MLCNKSRQENDAVCKKTKEFADWILGYVPQSVKKPTNEKVELDGCIVWNAHNTVLGEEALLLYIDPVCCVKTGKYGRI